MENSQVSAERTSKVIPASPTIRQFVFLSSCDLVCRPYPYINRIFFYKTKDNYTSIVESLKVSLSNALVRFFPLAGRFSENAQNGRLEIDCDDSGVEFVEASTTVPFHELEDDGFQHRPMFWKLARRTELLRSDYKDRPILSVQVTKFETDGLSIGISCSHVATDAQAFYDFMKSWAEISRGAALSLTPSHLRTALSLENLFPDEVDALMMKRNGCKKEEEMKAVPLKNASNVYSQEREMKFSNDRGLKGGRPNCHNGTSKEDKEDKPDPDLVQKVFLFTGEQLKRLKERARQEGKASFTTFEAFSAHWWKALVRARKFPDDQPVFLLIPFNCRKKFLSLPQGYFGNALDGALCKTLAGELRRSDLGSTAAKVHAAISAVSEDSFCRRIRSIECACNAIAHFDRNGLFHVVDSPKFAVYETDFGWGRPCAVRAEGFRFGAEVHLLASRREGGGDIDMHIALPAESMKRLEEDPEFLSL